MTFFSHVSDESKKKNVVEEQIFRENKDFGKQMQLFFFSVGTSTHLSPPVHGDLMNRRYTLFDTCISMHEQCVIAVANLPEKLSVACIMA